MDGKDEESEEEDPRISSDGRSHSESDSEYTEASEEESNAESGAASDEEGSGDEGESEDIEESESDSEDEKHPEEDPANLFFGQGVRMAMEFPLGTNDMAFVAHETLEDRRYRGTTFSIANT